VLNWREIAAAVTDLGGYAPPGSVVPTTIVDVTKDPTMLIDGLRVGF